MDTDISITRDGERAAVIEPPDPGHIRHDDLAEAMHQHLLASLRTIAAKSPARLFTIERTAEYLDTTTKAVRRLLESGELRRVRISRQQVRIRADDLAAFVDRRTETPADRDLDAGA